MQTISGYYELMRHGIPVGSCVAFVGKGAFSNIIRWTTGVPTHVGIVTKVTDKYGDMRITLLESTTLNGKKGVQETYLSERLALYDGEVYLIELKKEASAGLDPAKLIQFARFYYGRPYDWLQLFWAAIPWGWWAPDNASRAFCSEIAATVLKEWGVACLAKVHPASLSPKDFCQLPCFSETAIQIGGKPKAWK